jgi:hypothetical protein
VATGIGSKGQYITYLYTTRNPMIQLQGRFFYNILTEFVITDKIIRSIKICLKATARICEHLSDACCCYNGIRQRRALSPMLVNLALEYAMTSTKYRLDFLMAATMKIAVFWNVTLCSLSQVHRRFGGSC